MSLKSKRSSPRAMPVETIVTRYKSSQLKQCHKSVKANKNISSQHKQQSKHNINSTNKQRRRKLTEKTDKKDNIVCGEFHPDKLKRKMDRRKVILKPKHDYKVVFDANNCNKRKLNVPIKDVKRIRTNSESSVSSQGSVHTISEMITLLDASDNLNDEDLMEILTCPSPVWWEDPPPGYKEDSLSAQFTQRNKKPQDEFLKQNMESKLKNQEKIGSDNDKSKIDTNKIKLNPIFNEKDSKYLNKRSKLEALLGSIKDKVKSNKQSINQNKEIPNDIIKVNNNKQSNNKNKEIRNDIIKVNNKKQSKSNNKNKDIRNDNIKVNNEQQSDNQNKDIRNDIIKVKNKKQSNNQNDEFSNDIIEINNDKQFDIQNDEFSNDIIEVNNDKQFDIQNDEISKDIIEVKNKKQLNNENDEISNDIIEINNDEQSDNQHYEISNDIIEVNNDNQCNNKNDEISNDIIEVNNDDQCNNENDEISNDIIEVKIRKHSTNQNEEIKLSNNISYKSIKENIKIVKPVIKSPDVYLDKIKKNKNLNIKKCNNQKTNRSLLLHDYMFIPNSDIDNIEIDNKIKSIDNFDKINEKNSNNSPIYHRNNKNIQNDRNVNSNINSESNNDDDVIDLNSDETDDELLNTSLDDDTLSILENMQIPIHDSGIADSTIDNSTAKLGTTDSDIKNTNKSSKDDVDKSEITLNDDGKANSLYLKKTKSDPNKTALNISKELEKDTSDFITVYKITSKGSSENEKNGNINSYFKKSKFKPIKSIDPNDTNESSAEKKMVVATKEIVKYCI